MDEMNKVVEEVAVNNEVVSEVTKEAAKRIDFMELGVKGAAIVGLITIIGGAGYGCKKLYDRFVKKSNAEGEEEADTDQKETADETTETKNDKNNG